MSEHNHDHHDGDHEAAKPLKQIDPAMKSLSDALQVSFRILTFIMLLFVVLFLATGVDSIEPQEQGIVKVFGRVTRVVPQGFVYNWPFPIGEIQKVSTVVKTIEIDNFWMFETAAEAQTPIADRKRNQEGLRPGFDGYLVTGDRNLLHVRFICKYQVVKPEIYISKMADPEKVLREVLRDSAIEVAATRTADSILLENDLFLDSLQQLAQKRIDQAMGLDPESGIHAILINEIQLPNTDSVIWPLGAYDAYEKAQNAKSEKQTAINKAIADARQTLISAIGGSNYVALVGEPWETTKKPSAEPAYNLIGLYGQAVDQADNAAELVKRKKSKENQLAADEANKKADLLLERINRILTSSSVSGEASSVIADAESEKTRIIQSAQRRATRFEDLHSRYEKAPQLFLDKMWADVIDELMGSPTVEKWYFSPGEMGSIVRVNQDPQIIQALRNYRLKQQKEAGK